MTVHPNGNYRIVGTYPDDECPVTRRTNCPQCNRDTPPGAEEHTHPVGVEAHRDTAANTEGDTGQQDSAS